MKNIAFLLLLFAAACAEKKYSPQDETSSPVPAFKINKTQTVPGDGEFFYPRFLNDSSKIFFTSANYKGIWYFDRTAGTVTNLTEDSGAGYEIVFLQDSQTIFYITRQSNSNGRSEYKIKEIALGKSGPVEIYKSSEGISNLEISKENELVFYEGSEIVKLIPKEKSIEKNGNINVSLYKIEGTKLIKNVNGTEEIIFNADDNLIWLNQAGNKILIYESSKGCYLINNGKERFLGDLRNAQLSPDGNYIVYMLDEDDGHIITASDIYITTAANPNKSINLTNTEEILEMNPGWSPAGNEIVFNTYDGKVIIAQISVEQTGEK